MYNDYKDPIDYLTGSYSLDGVSGNMQDVWTQLETTVGNTFLAWNLEKRLDRILYYSPTFKPQDIEVVGTEPSEQGLYYSDHAAVVSQSKKKYKNF